MEAAEQIRLIRKNDQLTQAEFAKNLGVSTSTIASIENGTRDIPKNLMKKLVKEKKISAEWLLTGEGEMFRENNPLPTTSGKIPLLRQRVSCGPGQEWQDEDIVDGYIEPFGAFPSLRNAKLYAFRVSGTSMVGAGINDGDIVLFDASSDASDIRDDLYVFAFDGAVYCKLLKFEPLGKKISIYSLHSPELDKAELVKELSAEDPSTIEDFHLFGRVLAWLHENRLMWR